MKKIIAIFLILLISVWLGVQLNKDPGYVLIAINKWTLETPLWFAILSLIITFLVFHFIATLFSKLGNTKPRWQNWRQRRQNRKARKKTQLGLIEYSEGDWQKAESHLISGLDNNNAPLINYLAAAKAAQEQGNNKQRDSYLREAQQSMPEAKIAVELTQAQLQIANHQWEQALATLTHLQTLTPKHPYVLKLLMGLYIGIKDWPQLAILLPSLKRYKVLTDIEYQELELKTQLGVLELKINNSTTDELLKYYSSLPKTIQANPKVVASLCKVLIARQEYTHCEAILKANLKKAWDETLIALYGQCPISNSKKQLNFAESLLSENPNSAKLHLTLGQICSNNQLWGKARTYFEQSIAIHPTALAYAELAKLLDNLHDSDKAKLYYQKGLALALQA